MKTQKVLWTALPNGRRPDGQALRLSVLVSPRLQTDENLPTLTQFPDWLDWPARIRGATFDVQFAGTTLSTPSVQRVIPDRLAQLYPDLQQYPDSGLWEALFPDSTFVRPYTFKDYRSKFVMSYPVGNVFDFLKAKYLALAMAASDRLPLLSDLSGLFGGPLFEVRGTDEDLRDLKRIHGRTPEGDGGAVPPLPPDAFEDFLQFKLFHTPPAERITVSDEKAERATWSSFKRVALPGADNFANLIDFHQIVAALDQYPDLLRLLGLVVDLEVTLDPQQAAQLSSPLSIAPKWSPVSSDVVTEENGLPRTQIVLTGQDFRAASKGPEVAGGMLRLDGQDYQVMQVDVDGLAMKALNFASTLSRMLNRKTQDTPQEVGAPSPRSAGLSVVRRGRALQLADAFKNAFANNSKLIHPPQPGQPSQPDLYAEDLVRGYRVDVWDDVSKSWRSLCEREGTYRFVKTGQTLQFGDDYPLGRDEGIVRLGATVPADRDTNPRPTADLIYLGETLFGWAGWSLSAPHPGLTIDPEDGVKELTNKAPPGIGLEANFEVAPGTLPRLRFGRKYRVRARATDLAGNSLPPTDRDIGDGSAASNLEYYARFEPVSSPALALVEVASVPDAPEVESVPDAPEAGESMERVAIRSYNSVPSKDTEPSGETAQRHVVPPRITQKGAETHGKLDTPTGGPDVNAYDMLRYMDDSLKEVVLGGTTYAAEPEDLELRYLPDPFARGVWVRFLDRAGNELATIEPVSFFSKEATWPHAKPFRICLTEGDLDPKFDEATRILTVPLRKAEVVTVRLSSYVHEDDLSQMGIWQWIEEENPSNLEDLRKSALGGSRWMLTPWRDIVLVHAVQQPLVKPALSTPPTPLIPPVRALGETSAQLRFTTPISRNSTLKLDLLADWNEPVDDPTGPNGPDNLARRAHAFEHPVPIQGSLNETVSGRHEFGDTRYRKVNYKAEATTRFREYMPPAIAGDDADDDADDDAAIKRVSEPRGTFVQNSAPPESPRVLYVIPTFGWDDQGAMRTRRGGGLRVYMERPWYSSGYGEMLAVVLAPSGTLFTEFDDEPKSYKSYVTQWGRDPIWISTPVQGASPQPANFPQRIENNSDIITKAGKPFDDMPDSEVQMPVDPFPVTDLPLAELEGKPINVVPHAVFYDPDRRLWYSDIEVQAGTSYYPFVRLALARYHPVSVGGAHLSRIVLADFAQLAPDRSVTVTGFPGQPRARLVTVTGASRPGGGASTWPRTEIRIKAEWYDSNIGTDLGWKRVSATITPWSATPPVLWRGTVVLPQQPSDQYPVRLVIKEVERFLTDPTELTQPPPPPTGLPKEERIVYADIFQLSGPVESGPVEQ